MIKIAVRTISIGAVFAGLTAGAADRSAPAAASAYPERAPMARYLMESDAEIALARSAAPPSVSKDAEVLVLDQTGYRTAVKGTNGFVCMVWRSWSDDLGDPEFWSPKVRAPICLNPPAVSTVLPDYILRTEWVVSGLSRTQMQAEFKAAASSGELKLPASGAMSYMMAREGYLADAIGHAAPHIMFFVPRAEKQNWVQTSTARPSGGLQATSIRWRCSSSPSPAGPTARPPSCRTSPTRAADLAL